MKIDQNKISRNIEYIIYGICILIFITLHFGLGAKIQGGLINILGKTTGYLFFISINTLDHLFLASIPLFGMLYNKTRCKFKKKELILDILTVIISVGITFGVGIYILTFTGRPNNPLIPDTMLSEPFPLYTTILIGIGILAPYLILKLIKN